jgi:hypothetical protein
MLLPCTPGLPLFIDSKCTLSKIVKLLAECGIENILRYIRIKIFQSIVVIYHGCQAHI